MNFVELCCVAYVVTLLVAGVYSYFSQEGGSDHEDLG